MINQAKTLHDQLEQIGGCGDRSCIIHIRPGMHTNGGCRCNREPYKMSLVIYWHKRAVAEQAQENERLREALAFYADKNNWRSSRFYIGGQPGNSKAQNDRGAKARAALQPKEGE